MTLQTIKGGGALLPHAFGAIRPDINMATGTIIDAAGEKCAFVFQVPKSGTQDRVGFHVRLVTTAQTLRVGLETVDAATGAPTGTQYGGSAVGTQAAPVAGTFYEVTLATPATAVAGDIIAVVIQFDATVGNVQIGHIDGLAGGNRAGVPYINAFTTVWTKHLSGTPVMSVRYNDASYEFIGALPFAGRQDVFFNTGSTPDEIGNYFTLPAPVRVTGVRVLVVAANNMDIVLYEGSTVLRTISVDSDVTAGSMEYDLRFSTPVTLSAGTVYRIVFKPTTASNINMRELIVLSAGMMNMVPGGTDWYKTSRTDAGAWTEDTLRRVWGTGLLIDQIDDGVGGGAGGLLTHPGMGGGMRG